MLNDYVFILGDYKCDKNCPYCIAKMNKNDTLFFSDEISILKEKIRFYQDNNTKFKYFVLSGNGETSLYSYDDLKLIKNIVESSNLFENYRIQTSGNLFQEKRKLELFSNWLKEITVISFDSSLDKKFYKYKNSYLESDAFLSSSNIRVNIVVLKSNIDFLTEIIDYYSNLNCVSTIAIKILDRENNDSKESSWVLENALSYYDISLIIDKIKINNSFINFEKNRLIFKSKNDKIISLHYDPNNNYDYINISKKESFSWHNRKIKKGIYGEISKVEEELDEAREALEQNNKLMFLIELSDIIGAIEGIAEKHDLSLEDLINFSNKVKESKRNG